MISPIKNFNVNRELRTNEEEKKRQDENSLDKRTLAVAGALLLGAGAIAAYIRQPRIIDNGQTLCLMNNWVTTCIDKKMSEEVREWVAQVNWWYIQENDDKVCSKNKKDNATSCFDKIKYKKVAEWAQKVDTSIGKDSEWVEGEGEWTIKKTAHKKS